MQAIRLRCAPRNRFRLGLHDLGTTSEWLHSDTLFSGIINAHALLFGEPQTSGLVDDFRKQRIRFSSAFPLVQFFNGNQEALRLFFLPRPYCQNKPPQTDHAEIGLKKKIKKIRFQSLPVFKSMLQTVRQEEDTVAFAFDLLNLPRLSEGFVISRAEDAEIGKVLPMWRENGEKREENLIEPLKTIETPKVNLQKIDNAGPFYETDLCLNRGAIPGTEVSWETHFFFLIDHQLPVEAIDRFYAALRLLGDEGIGGERSCGAGHFADYEIMEFDWELAGAYQTNLALLSPLPEELNNIVSYESLMRGGSYLTGENSDRQRKLSIRMIKEGAVLRGETRGRLVEVAQKDGQAVYQNGLNFGLSFGEQT